MSVACYVRVTTNRQKMDSNGALVLRDKHGKDGKER